MKTYKIVRFFFATDRRVTWKKGLTLEQAQAHCADPESSSKTGVTKISRQRTQRYGAWFDGFAEER